MILCHKKILYLIGSFMDWIGRSLLGNEGKVNNSTSNILKEANIIINIIHSIIKIIKKPPEFHNVADMAVITTRKKFVSLANTISHNLIYMHKICRCYGNIWFEIFPPFDMVDKVKKYKTTVEIYKDTK